jgi:chemotaxis protein CheZ
MPKSAKQFTAERRLAAQGGFVASSLSLDGSPCSTEILAGLDEIKTMLSERPGPDLDTSPASDAVVRTEITQMVRTIGRTKSEIAAINHPMDEDDRLAHATGELDATLAATEMATQNILNASEKIEAHIAALAADLLEDADSLARLDHISAEVVGVIQACGFQDITGQRLSKVVKVLRHIERHILNIVDACGGVEAFADTPVPVRMTGTDADLMEGPQQEGQGLSQDDIDRLFD